MAARKKGEPPNRTKTTTSKASRGKPKGSTNGIPRHIARASAWADQRLKPSQKIESSEKYPGFGGPRPKKPRPQKSREGQGTLTVGGKTKASTTGKPKSWAKTYTKPSPRAQSAAARARRKKK